jgi:hypothetical protein
MADAGFNHLQTNAFTFTLQRMQATTFRITSAEVPSITVPPPSTGTQGATQYHPGSFTEFDELSLRFIVDEDLQNYEEIYHWITQQRYAIGTAYQPKSDAEKLLVSDGFLTTLTNKSNPNRTIYFKDMFPIALGSLAFNVQETPEPLTCWVTFRFSYFELR